MQEEVCETGKDGDRIGLGAVVWLLGFYGQ